MDINWIILMIAAPVWIWSIVKITRRPF